MRDSRSPQPGKSSHAHEAAAHGRPITRRAALKNLLLAGAATTAAGGMVALEPSPSGPKLTSVHAAPAVRRKTTIRFWTFLDPKATGPRERAQTQMIANFQAKYPEIEVVIEMAPWQTIDRQIIQAAQAGKGPDVSRIGRTTLAAVVKAKAVIPLNDFVSRWSQKERGDFIYSWDDTVFDGRKMAFFCEHRILGALFYRKDWFDQKTLKLPRTWDELAETAKALTTSRIAGITIGLSKKGNATDLRNWLFPWLWGHGTDVLNPDGTAAFNGDAGVKGFQWLADLNNKYKALPAGFANIDYDTSMDLLKSSLAAMAIHGTHRLSSARAGQGVGQNLQTTYTPGPTPDKPSPAQASGQTFAVSKDVKDKEAAWAFLEYMISPEGEIVNAKVAGEMPTRKSTYQDPWFKTDRAKDIMFWREYIEMSSKNNDQPAEFPQLMDALADAAQRIVLANAPVKKTLDEAAAKWHAVIKK